MKLTHHSFVTLIGLVLAGVVWLLPLSNIIDGFLYDFSLCATEAMDHESDVIIVGIDDDALLRYREPLVMWHKQLALVIKGVSAGGATRVGIDLIPAISMEHVAPGLDRILMQAIRSAARHGTEIVLGFNAGQHGMMPEKRFALAASGLGFLNLLPDYDGTIRRQMVSMQDEEGKTAFSLALLMAQESSLTDPARYNNTYIDYRQPPAQTVSLSHVMQLAEDHDKTTLQRLFNEKRVLIGMTSRKMQDIHRVPAISFVGETEWRAGVQIHAFMIETLLNGRIRKDSPWLYNLLLLIGLGYLSTLLCLKWPPRKALLTLTGLLGVAGLGGYLTFHSGYVLSASSALYGISIPAMVGLVFRLGQEYHLTSFLTRFLGTYVSQEKVESIRTNPRARLKQEKNLRKAITRREQVLYYQPKVDLQDGSIAGMEALVRWVKPNGEIVSPGTFIPLAEETGLVSKLTELVVDRACMFAKTVAKTPYRDQIFIPKISINLSAKDLERPDLASHLLMATAKYGVQPQQIDLEITESSIINRIDAALGQLSTLQDAGFSISIDDFGTGYSSLGHITRLPFHYLKIDKSLVDHVATERRAYAVVSTIITMSNSLGVQAIAEGIEDEQQLFLLKRLGCHQGQGYIFSRPLDESLMLELIISGKTFTRDLA